jgi:hypothetical protein
MCLPSSYKAQILLWQDDPITFSLGNMLTTIYKKELRISKTNKEQNNVVKELLLAQETLIFSKVETPRNTRTENKRQYRSFAFSIKN